MIEFPDAITRIAICGDWHRNYAYARKALNYAIKRDAEVVLHVGDLGIEGHDGYLAQINDVCVENDIIFMVADGNHENHAWLNAQPVDDDGVRRLYERVWHLPRGFRWEWCDVTFMALGGAHSVDKEWRNAGIDWFPEETITLGEAYRAAADGHVDVMITHDCPAGVNIPRLDEGKTIFPAAQLEIAERHRALLREVVNEVTPRFLWHGHYHRCYRDILDIDGENKCIVTGLDMDGKDFERNVNIVDVFTLAHWWVD